MFAFVYYVMAKGDVLGEFELFVLAALAQLGDEAYGVSIQAEIEIRARRPTSIGAVYATLTRLSDKGLVRFSISEPLPVPGGRARKHVHLTAAGHRALRDSMRAFHRMIDGLELDLQSGRRDR